MHFFNQNKKTGPPASRLTRSVSGRKQFIALLSVAILAGVCIWGLASRVVFAQTTPTVPTTLTTPATLQLASEKQISASAILLDGKGSPVPNGEYQVRFGIYRVNRTTADPYPSDTDSALRVWEETQTVTVKNGIMNAYLGATTAFPGGLTFEGGEYFLGIRVGTDSEMIPRKKFGTFTNAINSQFLRGRTIGGNAGDIVTYDVGGKINIKNLPTGRSGNTLLLANNSDFTGLLDDVDSLLGDVETLSGDSHAQNTDTGTDSLTFNLGSDTSVGSNNFDLTVSSATTAPAIRYNGAAGEWQFSDDGTTFTALGAGSGGGVTGAGTNGYVPYWTGANTLGSEQYLAVSRGGTGLDASGIADGQLLIGNDAANGFTLTGLTAGNGIAVSTGAGNITISINALTTGTTSTTQSNSGLETVASGVRLLGGCADDQILKWDSGTSQWICSNDLGGATAIIDVREGSTTYPGVDTLTFNATDFSVSQVGSEATVAIDYANSGITRSGQNETITGAWTFNGNATFGTIVGGTWNGTAIGATYGGTGINTSGSTGVPYISGGTWSVDATSLSVAHGGTGATTLNDLITLSTHTTGNYVATITNGNGISGSASSEGATPTIAIDLLDSADGTGGTSSNSGLEFQGSGTNELTLLQGCSNNQLLLWNDSTNVWYCGSVSGAGGVDGSGTANQVAYFTDSDTLASEAQLSVSRGGTGIGSYTIGDLLYASGATTLAALADVATGNVLISGGVGVAPSWGKVGLTTHVTGTLPVANGGTGATTLNDLITLSTHTTGNYVATITNGNGISGSASSEGATPTIAIDLLDSADGTGGTSSNSGLEFQGSGTNELTLLQGCSNNQLLLWNDSTNVWYCGSVSGAGGVDGSGTANQVAYFTDSDTLASEAQLSVSRGGTGIGSYTIGDLLYASGATTLAALADVATGNVLISGGVGVAPSWGKVGLTTHVTGTLPVANGGTGATTLNDLITLSTHTTGNYVATITNGNGISGSASSEGATPTIAIDLLDSADGTGGTSSNSGLEFQGSGTNELTLLQGCSNNQLLLWNDSTNVWYCGSVSGAGGVDGSGTANQVAYFTDSDTLASEAQLSVSRGGTGIGSYTIGDLLYASGATTLAALADVATGNVLISGGVGVAPSWGKVGLTTHVTGVLPLANGGTGSNLSDPGGDRILFWDDAPSGAVDWLALASNLSISGTTIDLASSVTINSLQLGANGTDGAFTIFSEQGGTDYTTIFQPGTQTQNVTYTLPVDDGTSGQVLLTNGTGTLSWSSVSGAGGVTGSGTNGYVAYWDSSSSIAAEQYLSLTRGGTGTTLSDPNADRILFWDDSGGAMTWLTPASNLSISGTTLDLASSVQLGANGNDGILTLFSEQGGTDYTTVFQPGTQTQNITYTLPVNDGDASQVLVSDGSGGLSWQSVSGVGALDGTGSANAVAYWVDSNTLTYEAQLALSRGGTGANLSDPNADRILFWDDSAGVVDWLTPASNLSISGTTLDLASSVQLGANGADGILTLYSEQGGTDYTTIFQPGTQTQNVTYTLPVNDGDASQVLVSDGSGVLSWSSVSGVGGVSGTGTNGYVSYWTGTSTLGSEQYLAASRGGTGLNTSGSTGVPTISSGTWSIASTLGVTLGGTGVSTFGGTNTLLYTSAANTLSSIIAGTNGQLLLGVTGSAPTFATMSGDATIASNGALTIANNAVTLTTDTTGNYVASITNGNGISGSASSEGATPTIAIDLLDSADGTGGTSSNSGLEFQGSGTNELTLLQGCSNNQLLLWNDSTNVWYCGSVSGAGGVDGSGTANQVAYFTDSDTLASEAQLSVSRGGTGIGSYTIGDLLYASGATTLAALADVATGNVLISGGVGVAPSWGKVGLTTHVTGTLPVANGGTGATTLNDLITLSTHTTGNYVASITNGNGISGSASSEGATPTIAIDLLDSADGTGGTSSNSGLEFQGSGTNELTLLQGCSNNQLLLWNDSTNVWYCGSVSGAGGVDGSGTANQVAYFTDSDTLASEAQLSVSRGGTGIGSYTIGDLLYASGATTLAALADVATGNVLISGGVGVAPSWGKVGLTTHVTGTLPVANGGTGATTLNDLITLSTHTTGNYVASITNGSGISGGNGGSEGAALTLALGVLTGDWSQTGAYDIVLNNASSELKILESSGDTYYGIFDIADLSTNDKTYTFPNTTGTVVLGTGITNYVSYWSGTNTLSSEAQLAVTRGGTGTDSSGWTGVPYVSAGAWNVSSTVALSRGGTGANLSDPNADRILFWDDSGGAMTWLTPASNLSISGTTLDLASSVQLGANGNDGILTLFSEQGGTDYTTVFQPGTQTQNITYTLPVNDGDASQVLVSDGSGVLSWSSVSGVGGVSGTGTNGYVSYWTGTSTLGSEQYLAASRGGTGLNTSGSTGVPYISSGTWSVDATSLSVAHGGTGATTLNDLITLSTHTTGNYVASATASGGLVMTGTEGGSLGILLQPSGDALSSTTSSGSGLELLSTGVTLLQGCASGEVLAWNETSDVWACTNVGGIGGANTALSNLSSVAINTSLISDADNTDDLGSAANSWKDVYTRTVRLDGSTSGTITLQPAAIAGTNTITLPANTGTVALTTDLHAAVTLAGTYDYLTLSTQQITLGQIDLTTDVTGVLPVTNGGTGLNASTVANGQILIGHDGNNNFSLATITAGNGIEVTNAAGSITLATKLLDAADGAGGTSSRSGLEFGDTGSNELTLLQGCSDNQVLAWNDSTNVWECSSKTAGTSDWTRVLGTPNFSYLTDTASHLVLGGTTEAGGDFDFDVTNNSFKMKETGGTPTLFGILQVADLSSADKTYTFPDLSGTVTLTTNNLGVFAATTSAQLSGVLSDENTSGGYMTDPMTTVGDIIYGGASGVPTRLAGAGVDNYILKYDLDTNTPFWAAESGGSGASKWTQGTGFTYLTTTSDDLVVGATTTTAPFFFDTSAGKLKLGMNSVSGSLDLYSEVGGTDYTLSLQPSSGMTQSTTYTFPTAYPGGNGYILAAQTDGTMSWISNTGGSGSSKWSENGTITYLTQTAYDLAVGGSTSAAPFFFDTSAGKLKLGANGTSGSLDLYSEIGGTDYAATLFANTAMSSNANFYLPADEPAATYLLNMTSGGVIGFDTSTYATTAQLHTQNTDTGTDGTAFTIGDGTTVFTVNTGATDDTITIEQGTYDSVLSFTQPGAATQTYTFATGGTVCTTGSVCSGYQASLGYTAANTALSNLSSVAINASLIPGVAGTLDLGSSTYPWHEIFLSGTSGTPGTNQFKITGASTSGLRTITLPDASGTVALTTNNLGVFAATTSAQLSGVLSDENTSGGYMTDPMTTVGDIIYGAASGVPTRLAGGTNGQILQANTGAAPSWSTAAYPATTTINQLLYSSAANTITGLATANSSFLTTNGSGVPGMTLITADTFTQYALLAGRNGGQILIGGTGAGDDLTFQTTSNVTKGSYIFSELGSGLVLSTSGTLSVVSNTLHTQNTDTGTDGTAFTIGDGTTVFTINTGATDDTITIEQGTYDSVLSFTQPGAATQTYTFATGGTVCTTGSVCSGYQASLGYTAANTALSNLSSVAINASLIPGVAGTLDLGSSTYPWHEIFLSGTSGTPGTNQFKITGASTSGLRTITLPDASGTVALTTNNLGVFAATTSAQLSGVLSDENTSGGYMTDPMTTVGDIIYGAASGVPTRLAGGTNGQILQANTGAAPSWSTAAYPATTTINQLLYSSAANTITGLATANSSFLTTNGSGVPGMTLITADTFTQYALLAGRNGGQILIGGTGAGDDLTFQTTSNVTKGSYIFSELGSGLVLSTSGTLSVVSNTLHTQNTDTGTDGTAFTIGDGTTVFTINTGATDDTITIEQGTYDSVLSFTQPGAATQTYTFATGGTVCTTGSVCSGYQASLGYTAANTALSNLSSVAINASLIPGVAGTLDLGSSTYPWHEIFLSGTSGTPGTNQFKITGASTSGLRTITLPDASGTVALTTNNLGVFAATTSAQLSGVLSDENTSGGYMTDPMTTVGDIIYGAASGVPTRLAGGTNGQILQANTGAAPSWSTAAYPATTTINQLLYSSAANTITGLATANSSFLTTNGSGVPGMTLITADTFTQYALLAGRNGGQILIGGTGAGDDLTFQTTSNVTKGSYIFSELGSGLVLSTTGTLSVVSNTLHTQNTDTGTDGTAFTIGDGTTVFTINTGATDDTITIEQGTYDSVLSFTQPGAATQTYTFATGGTVCTTGSVCSGYQASLGYTAANTALSNLSSVAINASLIPGVAGTLDLGSSTYPWHEIFLSGTSGTPGTNQFKITGASTSGLRTITLPDASGTVALTTNNLGVFAATTSAQLSGVLSDENTSGGYMTDPMTTVGDIIYGAASGVPTRLAGGTNGQILQANTGAAPSWSTAAYPATTTINQLLYSSAANTITGLATANSSFLTTNGSGVPGMTLITADTFTQYALLAGRNGGQILIGGTGAGDDLTFQTTSNVTKGSYIFSELGSGLVLSTTGTLSVVSNTLHTQNTDTGTDGTAFTIGDGTTVFTVNTGATDDTITIEQGTYDSVLSFTQPGAATQTYTFATGGTVCTTGSVCSGYQASLGYTAANTALSNLSSVAINASLIPGVAGTLDLGSSTYPWHEIFLSGTSGTPGTNQFKITGASTSGLRTITLPDASGTVALTTNNLGVFAATTSAQLSGVLSDENTSGGYMTDPMTTVGDIIYGGASGVPTRLAGGTNGQMLQANTGAAPSWSTAAYPATTTINQLLYSSAANTITGLATANSSFLTTNGSGVPGMTLITADTFTQYALLAGRNGGQILIGGTGAGDDLTFQTTSNVTKGSYIFSELGSGLVLSTTGTLSVVSNTLHTQNTDTGTDGTAFTIGDGTTVFTVNTGATDDTITIEQGTYDSVLSFTQPGAATQTYTFATGGTVCTTGSVCSGYQASLGYTAANTALSNLSSVAINASLIPGVAGTLDLGSSTYPWHEIFLSGTSGTPGTNQFKITGASTSGLRTITLPDASGTVALTTNNLGVFAATTSAQLSGVLSDENTSGGYMTDPMTTVGDIIYGGASGVPTRLAGGTNGQMLQANTGAAPSWSTAAYPATTTINQLLYSSAANTITGLATANSSFLTTNGSGVPGMTLITADTFTQYALLAGRNGGQILIGGTGAGDDLTFQTTSNVTKGSYIFSELGSGLVLSTTGTLSVVSNTLHTQNTDTGTDGTAFTIGDGTTVFTVNTGATDDTITIEQGTYDSVLSFTQPGAATQTYTFATGGTVWTSGNDGTTSTLDADLLDNVDSLSFLRSDTSDSFTSGTLSFSDGTVLDLSAIVHDDSAVQGLKLPQNTTLTSITGGTEGYIAYDSDDNKVKVFDGSNWVDISGTGASTTLQEAYGNDVNGSDTILSLTADDDSLIFTNPSSSGTDSAFLLQLNQANTTGGVVALDLVQASNNANAMNITANSIDTETGLSMTANALTTGNGISISSTSTAGNGSKLLNLTRSGTNGTGGMTNYGLYSTITNAGATSTNVAGYFSASGGTTANYGLLVAAGSVGIGDTTPDSILDILATDAANTYLTIGNTNAGDYNPTIRFELTENSSLYSLGIDDSDSDTFKIYSGSDIAGTSEFMIDSTGVTTISQLKVGAQSFEDDAGAVVWTDMNVTSASSDNTVESYVARMDGTDMLTIYALVNGSSGAIDNKRVFIGTSGAGSTTPALFGLDVKSDTGDPTENFEGAMYYNTADNKFRCYQGSAWTDCIASIAADSLDFVDFQDTLDLDANLTLNQTTYTWTQNFTGTTTTGLTYNADSLTSGSGMTVASTAAANFTGSLVNINLSAATGAASNTGSLLMLTNSGTSNANTALYVKHYATGTNNLAFRIDDESGDTTPFVVTGTGAVGIGTTAPTSGLELYNAGANPVFTLTGAHATDYDPQIAFRTDASPTVKFSLGVDASNDYFKIYSGDGIGDTSEFMISDTGVTTISQLQVGAQKFEADGGVLSWVDMDVTSSASDNTVESYSAQLDGINMLTIYALVNGSSGAIDNKRVFIGTSGAGSTTPALFGLDVKSDTGDPTENFEGAMYYNTADNKFRCYQGSAWTDCISSIAADSLDFVDFQDTLDLDANLTLNQTTYTWTQNFTGTTTTGLTYNADSLTSGSGMTVASTAAANFTGSLVNINLSAATGAASNTGSLLMLTNSGTSNANTALYVKHYATGTNNLAFRIDDESGDTTPFVVTGTGAVGIGTTAPVTALELYSAAAADNIFTLTANTIANDPLIKLRSAATTLGVKFSLGIDTSDSEKFKIDSGDGLGTTADFVIDSTGVTTIASAKLGAQSFPGDGGILSWVDMSVTSDSVVGTAESYSAQIDSNPLLTIYAESDGSGGIQNQAVKLFNGAMTAKNINTNFGAYMDGGAFVDNTSYYGEEFAADTVTARTTDTADLVGDNGKWYFDSTATTATYTQWDQINGYGTVAVTTTGTDIAGGIFFGDAQDNLSLVFAKANLPVAQMKVRNTDGGTTGNDVVWGFTDTATVAATNDTLPANGIFFWSNNTTTWTGVVRSGGANVGTATCSGGTISTTQFAVGRIEVVSSTSVNFYMDYDASNGVSPVLCGNVSGANPTAALGLGAYVVHTGTTATNVDVDYMRVWQDDAAPGSIVTRTLQAIGPKKEEPTPDPIVELTLKTDQQAATLGELQASVDEQLTVISETENGFEIRLKALEAERLDLSELREKVTTLEGAVSLLQSSNEVLLDFYNALSLGDVLTKDADGNLDLSNGKIRAKMLETGALAIEITDEEAPSIGSGILLPKARDEKGAKDEAGNDIPDGLDDTTGDAMTDPGTLSRTGYRYMVRTKAVSVGSRIFITPKRPTAEPLAVTAISAGEGFTVELKNETSEEIPFDWIVVEER
jgi:hypothetical protein